MPSLLKAEPPCNRSPLVTLTPMLTVEETSALLRMEPSSLRSKIRRGEDGLITAKIGRRILINGESVAALLRNLGIEVVVVDVNVEDLG